MTSRKLAMASKSSRAIVLCMLSLGFSSQTAIPKQIQMRSVRLKGCCSDVVVRLHILCCMVSVRLRAELLCMAKKKPRCTVEKLQWKEKNTRTTRRCDKENGL